MKNIRQQTGFTIIEAVLILAVVVVLSGVGYLAYNNFVAHKTTDDTTANTTSHTDASGKSMAMPSISSTSDLDTAAKSLDDTSFDNDGLSQIDNDAGNF
jgi:Tfp pilus assembly protein PilE